MHEAYDILGLLRADNGRVYLSLENPHLECVQCDHNKNKTHLRCRTHTHTSAQIIQHPDRLARLMFILFETFRFQIEYYTFSECG